MYNGIYLYIFKLQFINPMNTSLLSYFCGTVDFIDNFVYLENIHTLKCKKKIIKNTYIYVSVFLGLYLPSLDKSLRYFPVSSTITSGDKVSNTTTL